MSVRRRNSNYKRIISRWTGELIGGGTDEWTRRSVETLISAADFVEVNMTRG